MSRRARVTAIAAAGIAAALGLGVVALTATRGDGAPAPALATRNAPAPPSIAVTRARVVELADSLLLNGTLVARDEILVGPEVEGHRIVELLVDDGDRVAAGQVLARLSREMIDVLLAQNAAAMARADAAVAQARSQIAQMEAASVEAAAALERSRSLQRSGVASQEQLDQRLSTARGAAARLSAARDGLAVAEAERAQTAAVRRELELRLARTEIRSPAAGIVSRRTARVGAIAASANEALFNIVADGAIEFEAELPEIRLPAIAVGQTASVTVAGLAPVPGRVRMISAEVDRQTRLARLRVALEPGASLRIGQFARGTVEVARRRGVAVPLSAVVFAAGGPTVQRVRDGRVETRAVRLGIADGGAVEILDGIADGDDVVLRAGAFLRDGDAVTPLPAADATAPRAVRP